MVNHLVYCMKLSRRYSFTKKRMNKADFCMADFICGFLRLIGNAQLLHILSVILSQDES